MKKPLDYYGLDFVDTYKILTSHWLEFTLIDLATFLEGVQPFFLTLKLRIKKNNNVWFLKSVLGQIVMQLILNIPEIKANGRTFSNKTPHRIGISHTEEAHFLVKNGMQITRHM